MLIKILPKLVLGSGICAAALAGSAAGLYGDTVVHSVEGQRCADGSCVPRRLTNGFYPTTWRRWPVEPPARAKPGVREGISAPSIELPSPKTETYLPEGLLIAPPPLEQGGDGGDFGPPPTGVSPVAPPPGPATPRGEAQEGLAPELRSGQFRAPNNKRTQERVPNIAGREVNRPAAVMEALRNEAAWRPDRANSRSADPSIPAALPDDIEMAQPLPPPPAAETPSINPKARSVPASNRSAWQPAATRQPEVDGAIAAPERPAFEQTSAGLNAPAAIHARLPAGDARRPASRADFSISASDSPAPLAVRTVSQQSWSQSSPHRNPLRSGSAVTKVAFEYSDLSGPHSSADVVRTLDKPAESAAIEIPNNPLRR